MPTHSTRSHRPHSNPVRWSLLLALLLVPLGSGLAGSDPAAGLVLTRSGEVAVHQAEGIQQAVEGLVIREGDTVVARPGGRCTGFAPSGEPFVLKGPEQLVFAGEEKAGGLAGIPAWIRKQILIWTGGRTRRPLVTRTGREWRVEIASPAPLIPAPDGQVRPGRSRFAWATAQGTDRTIVVFAAVAGEETRRIVRGNRMVLEDLTPGARYVWKVLPAVEGWEVDPQWRAFRVMTPEEAEELDDAIRNLGDLEAGVLLLSAGLHGEALGRFDAAVASGDASRSARVWRAQGLAEIGLHEEAFDDLMQATGLR